MGKVRIIGILLLAIGGFCGVVLPYLLTVEGPYSARLPNTTLMGIGIGMAIVGFLLFFLGGTWRGGKIYSGNRN